MSGNDDGTVKLVGMGTALFVEVETTREALVVASVEKHPDRWVGLRKNWRIGVERYYGENL